MCTSNLLGFGDYEAEKGITKLVFHGSPEVKLKRALILSQAVAGHQIRVDKAGRSRFLSAIEPNDFFNNTSYQNVFLTMANFLSFRKSPEKSPETLILKITNEEMRDYAKKRLIDFLFGSTNIFPIIQDHFEKDEYDLFCQELGKLFEKMMERTGFDQLSKGHAYEHTADDCLEVLLRNVDGITTNFNKEKGAVDILIWNNDTIVYMENTTGSGKPGVLALQSLKKIIERSHPKQDKRPNKTKVYPLSQKLCELAKTGDEDQPKMPDVKR